MVLGLYLISNRSIRWEADISPPALPGLVATMGVNPVGAMAVGIFPDPGTVSLSNSQSRLKSAPYAKNKATTRGQRTTNAKGG